jgi:hypothetical protein
MAYSMLIVLDQWKGTKDLLVVNLDDFDIILNLDFVCWFGDRDESKIADTKKSIAILKKAVTNTHVG